MPSPGKGFFNQQRQELGKEPKDTTLRGADGGSLNGREEDW